METYTPFPSTLVAGPPTARLRARLDWNPAPSERQQMAAAGSQEATGRFMQQPAEGKAPLHGHAKAPPGAASGPWSKQLPPGSNVSGSVWKQVMDEADAIRASQQEAASRKSPPNPPSSVDYGMYALAALGVAVVFYWLRER